MADGCESVVDEMKGRAVSDHSEANNAPSDAVQVLLCTSVLCVRTEYCGPTLIIIGPELGRAY